MQLVIEISEANYEYFKNTSFVEHEDCLRQSPEDRRGTMNLFRLVDAVKDGIVLPEGHGDLIDRDILKKDDETALWLSLNAVRTGKMIKYFSELFIKKIDGADAIIPADKEGDLMSIWSDHDVGALTDEEFEMEGIRMNNEDRAERDKLFEMDREAEECFQKACERDD